MFIKKRNFVSLSYLIMCLFLHTLFCFIIYSSRMAQTTHGSRIGFSFTRRESETLSFWRAWVFTMTGYLLLKHCNSKPHSKLSRNATASAVCRPQTAHSEWNGSFHHWNTTELYQTLKHRHKFIMRVFELHFMIFALMKSLFSEAIYLYLGKYRLYQKLAKQSQRN